MARHLSRRELLNRLAVPVLATAFVAACGGQQAPAPAASGASSAPSKPAEAKPDANATPVYAGVTGTVVASAKPTRAGDFRGLDNAEVVAKIDELKREKLRLQYMQKTRGNLLNPGSVRQAAEPAGAAAARRRWMAAAEQAARRQRGDG